jgi:hypothetical protein
MVAGAARLVDGILPVAPVRQYVLTLPPPLRFMLAYDAAACSQVLGLFIAEVFRWLRWTAKRELALTSVAQAYPGSFTAIHRGGGSANLNVHFHAGVLDGVYVAASPHDPPRFQALPAPSRNDLLDIAARVYARTRRWFGARGQDWEQPHDLDDGVPALLVQQPLLLDCARASLLGVGLMGEQAGKPLLPRGGLEIPQDLRPVSQTETGGFDLQAARRVSATDRDGLERMCRYLLHPPLSHDRLQLLDDGRVRLRFSRPWRSGADAITLTPFNFIARLIPLIPPPRAHQLVYHGVLAAGAAHRPHVIPPRPKDGRQLPMFDRASRPTPMARGKASSSTPQLGRVCWARLLKRMAGYELEACPRCGQALVMVAAVLDPHDIELALASRGLLPPTPPLERSPSRGPPPPQLELPLPSPSPAQAEHLESAIAQR